MFWVFRKIWQQLNAAQIAALGFVAVILIGTVLLMLPAATVGQPLSGVDALFTATSATCVTGLIVVDTGTKFTFFGQLVILLLIQIGGFGIMTLSTFILFVIGRKASIHLSAGAGGSFLKLRRYSLSELLRKALLLTFGFEFVAFVILFFRWSNDFPTGQAVWYAVFHSVSAFCNAGFSLFPDSLIRYVNDPIINVTIMPLIITGGIGFYVLIDLWDTIRGHEDPAKRRVSFHTKIVLSMTLLLIIGGSVLFYMLEYRHNLAGLGMTKSILPALFQSVTARTAGFNTMDFQNLSNASLFLIAMLMFIGGAPGSMAGGVKVTTVGVLFIVAISRLKGARTPSIFGRSLTRGDIERGVSLILISGTLIAIVVLVLLMTELGSVPHAESRGMFMELVFECVSAFGTVGLSTGYTSHLTHTGRIIITLLMFIGRLGPLTLVFAMQRRKPSSPIKYPEERIMIG